MDVVEFIEEFGSWKKIVPPITNSNFKEYYVLVSPYSHIAMKLEARGDEKLQTLTCTDLYKKLAKILIKKYDLDALRFWENEYETYKSTVLGCKCTHSCNVGSMIKYDKNEIYDLFS